MEVPPPAIPDDRLEGWRRVDSSVETPFDAKVVTVRAHTLVFEDADRGPILTERTGVDTAWRFVFVTRIQIRPNTRPSAALSRVVRNGAADGFEERLADRGFESIRKRDSRSVAIGDGDGDKDGTLVTYSARCVVDSIRIPLEGMLAVWTRSGQYYVGGGAYPVSVPQGADPNAVASIITPDEDRVELLELFRSVGTTDVN